MSFYYDIYKKKATEIVSDAIKSALYIDENAWEPYSKIPRSRTLEVMETKLLSEQLYKHFQNHEIALTVHKFKNVNSTIPHLTSKDLVLLDWQLEGEISGGELALELLEEIVEFDHINFCCIYTKNKSLDNVINNCISYFSGQNNEFYQGILNEFDGDDEFFQKLNPFLITIIGLNNIWDDTALTEIKKRVTQDQDIAEQIGRSQSLKKVKEFNDKLRYLAIAFTENLIKSKSSDPPRIINLNKKQYIFTINNTVILILGKDAKNDKNLLVRKIRNELIEKQNSYLLILGLELQNHLRNSSAFISGDVLDAKNAAIAYHWHTNIKSNSDPHYKEFVKQIMVDQVDFTIKQYDFKLLDRKLLWKKHKEPTSNDIAKINTFYNGILSPGDRLVNLGDIFQSNTNEFYLCITALCDCLYPYDNIKNKYIFVKGKKFQSIDDAVKLGDESFISYINENTCITWVGLNKGTNIDQHKPIYVKPIQLYIPKPTIIDNVITAFDWYEKCPVSLRLEYKFTLRPNYAQRIANHAFSHPLRVGIDFVKKN